MCELLAVRSGEPFELAAVWPLADVAWVLGYTIAVEIGDIGRFASPKSFTGTPGCVPSSAGRAAGPSSSRAPTA